MLVLLSAAYAAAPLATSPLSRADLEEHAGLFDQLDAPDHLGCRTELVEALRAHWGHFSADERAQATEVLAPFKEDLFDMKSERNPAGAPPPAKAGCWSQDMDNVLNGDHFTIEYEDGVDKSKVQQFLDDLETSWEVEVDDNDWQAPDATDDYLMLIQVQNKRTYGAYTTVASCHGTYMPYIVSGDDSWDDLDWGATMAAHEFNHASQYGYSYAPEFWYWEATATWIEHIVFPSVHEWAWYVAGYTDNPWIALNGEDQRDMDIFNHMYGMAIWNFYIDDNLGGPDAVRETWENARDERGQYTYGAKDMVSQLGEDFDAAYLDFIGRNTVMDYAEGQWIPDVDLKDTVTSFPASGKSSGGDVPQGYGQNYIKFKGKSGEGDLTVKFEGDDSVDWDVVLLEGEYHDILRLDTAVSKNGAATVSLAAIGDKDVYLVVSPVTSKEGEYDYSWDATVKASSSGEDTGGTEDSGVVDDTGEATDTGDDGNGDNNTDTANQDDNSGDGIDVLGSTGCGCDAGASQAVAGMATMLAAFSAARRRRSA